MRFDNAVYEDQFFFQSYNSSILKSLLEACICLRNHIFNFIIVRLDFVSTGYEQPILDPFNPIIVRFKWDRTVNNAIDEVHFIFQSYCSSIKDSHTLTIRPRYFNPTTVRFNPISHFGCPAGFYQQIQSYNSSIQNWRYLYGYRLVRPLSILS